MSYKGAAICGACQTKMLISSKHCDIPNPIIELQIHSNHVPDVLKELNIQRVSGGGHSLAIC